MGAGCRLLGGRVCGPGAILTLPVGNTHYGGHGGPWQGSTEAGGLAPTAQLCSSSPSPDSRETQRKMGRQTPFPQDTEHSEYPTRFQYPAGDPAGVLGCCGPGTWGMRT